MKKFILTLVLALACTTSVHAIGETATATTQKFIYNGVPVTIKSYVIKDANGDTNFISARDLCIVFDKDLKWVENPPSAYVDTTHSYSEDKDTPLTDPYPPTAITEFSPTTIYVDSKWQLMQAHQILDRTYVKLRDGVKHLKGSVDYDESTNTVYLYSEDSTPAPTPTPTSTSKFNNVEQADKAVAPFIEKVNNSGLSDADKIYEYLADYVADHLDYDNDYADAVNQGKPYDASKSSLNYIFTHTDGKGVCGAFVNAFEYLCEKANIPCVYVGNGTHAWNEVYVDGEWLVCDITNYNVGRGKGCLLITYKDYPFTDGNTARTAERKADALK